MLTIQARGDEEWCANNFPLYNIPGLRRAPKRQAKNVKCNQYQELVIHPTHLDPNLTIPNWNTAVPIYS